MNLKVHGYTAVQVVNFLQWQTKKPFPLSFVDLKPDQHNSDIFKLSSICFTKIKVEEPRPRQHLIQCHRCQNVGHTKSYCNHQPPCVKCSELHIWQKIVKSQSTNHPNVKNSLCRTASCQLPRMFLLSRHPIQTKIPSYKKSEDQSK